MNTPVIPCDHPETAFEKWWDEYHRPLMPVEPKQLACDAYAAGMADPMVAPPKPTLDELLTMAKILRNSTEELHQIVERHISALGKK